MTRTLHFAASLLAVSTLSASAATLVNWDFSGLTAQPAAQENVAATNPLLASSTANATAGLTSSDLTHTGLLYSTAVAPGGTGTAVDDELNLKNFDTASPTATGINDNFFTFTLTADTPGTLNVDSLSVRLWRNGGGAPDAIEWDVSINGGAFADYGTTQVAATTGLAAQTVYTFTQAIAGADSVTFKFAPRRNTGTSAATGNLHIDQLSVAGSVVPEPSSSVLLLGLAGLLARRRR